MSRRFYCLEAVIIDPTDPEDVGSLVHDYGSLSHLPTEEEFEGDIEEWVKMQIAFQMGARHMDLNLRIQSYLFWEMDDFEVEDSGIDVEAFDPPPALRVIDGGAT